MRFRLLMSLVVFVAVPEAAWSQARLQRFTLVAGANDGGAERPRLRYAVADAERFARVLVDLGGVERADEIVLKDPTVSEFVAGLDRLAARVSQAKLAAVGGGRTEVLVYYSGHADEQGLLLGDDRYSYRSLRDRLERLPADVKIAVLDACASGAFTRLKSGRTRPAFLVDEGANMRGHAFLTSSAATEAAQESDRIRASYFTHYLVSGFRGAADLSGDGKVTLNEAYQFAFAETLGKTVDSKGGPQHPSYDINLSGSGDVVMTDLRQTTATLVLDDDLEGRFFVRNARRELIAELNKPRGRRIELAVEPGSYEVRLEAPRQAVVASATLTDRDRLVLTSSQFSRLALEPTRSRGEEASPDFGVRGRSRIAVRFGQYRQSDPETGQTGFESMPAIEFTHYAREDFALVAGAQVHSAPGFFKPAGPVTLPTGSVYVPEVNVSSGVMLAMPLQVRWNPLTRGRERRALKPFLFGGIVPTLGWGAEKSWAVSPAPSEDYRKWAVSLQIGAGLDVHLTERFALGVNGGYNAMAKGFSRPIGGKTVHSGPDFGVSLGWLFGK